MAEMVMESLRVPRRAVTGAQGGGDGGGAEEVLACGRLDWTEPGRDSREREGRVLLTDVTAGGVAPGARRAGPRPALLSLPFWMEAWPRLALSRSGEFLLRFVLVEGSAVLWEEGEELYLENQSGHKSSSFSPFYHEQWRERGGEKGCC